MSNANAIWTHWTATVVLLVGLLAAPSACGQSEPQADPITQLRAEVSVDKTLYTPGEPIHLRCTLFNPTNKPIDVTIHTARDAGDITLPAELVFGTHEQPALLLALEPEATAPILPRLATTTNRVEHTLRIGSRTSIGTEIDLNKLDRRLRYTGNFRIEWQPFGPRIPAAATAFQIQSRKQAILVTDYGKITFSLMYEQAPANVENLLDLITSHFYDSTRFHRIVPGFLIQGGSPDGTSAGIRPDGKTVPAELHDYPVDVGTMAMALRGGDLNSASCQFFIALARLPELDGKYTVVGQASDPESLRTLEKIAELPTDENYHPLRPVVIRFFTLIDAPPQRTTSTTNPAP